MKRKLTMLRKKARLFGGMKMVGTVRFELRRGLITNPLKTQYLQ